MQTLNITDLDVALVEPSKMQTNVIERSLKDCNVQNIRCYQSGTDILSHIHLTPPDLVISTMYLPDMTGTDLVHSLRADHQLEEIPFMLISSESSFAMLDPIRQAGVVAILPKPFTAKQLRQALSSTLVFMEPDDSLLQTINMESLQVLVVDDSNLARKHIMRVLKNLGIEQMTAVTNGKEALQQIESNFFDLVVTDYNMPEMDGEMLTRFIRNNSSQGAIPILMVTSEGDQSRLSAVQQAGVSGICDKPFEPTMVKQMIQNMLAP